MTMSSPPNSNPKKSSNCSNSHEAFLKSFPPGYRFKPRDEELVLHYLKKKLYNQELPPNLINEVELYRYDPITLVEECKLSYGEGEWYFFTPREKKYPKGLRPRPAAADGFWKATGADVPLLCQGEVVGSRKSLVFYRGKPPKGDKTDWMMHEFRLKDPPPILNAHPHDMLLDEWVLRKIYKKNDKTSKTTTFNARRAAATQEKSDKPTPISEIQELDKPIPISLSQQAWEPLNLNYGGGGGGGGGVRSVGASDGGASVGASGGGVTMGQMDQPGGVSFPTSPAYHYYDDSMFDPTALFLDDAIPYYYDPSPNLLLPLPSSTTSATTSSATATAYPNFGYSSQFFNSLKKQP